MHYTTDDVGDTPGKPPLTEAKKQAKMDEWNASEAARPLQDWQRDMAAHGLSDVMEDIIDAMDPTTFARLSSATKALHAAKKTLRGQRPT